MTAFFQSRFHFVPNELCCDDDWIMWHRPGLEVRWLKATFRTVDFRRNELEQTHWHKVWRLMFED
jgi:hypothetical protein